MEGDFELLTGEEVTVGAGFDGGGFTVCARDALIGDMAAGCAVVHRGGCSVFSAACGSGHHHCGGEDLTGGGGGGDRTPVMKK